MVTIFLFLVTLLIKKTIPTETGYLFKDLNDSNNDSDNKNLIENNLANSCQLQVFTDLKDNESIVFGGNGFNYDVSCDVYDPKSKIGDKYYVIDLVVYGPNTRVAKAWREQFSLSTAAKSRKIAIKKKLSFHSLGLNSVVCGVSKYNSLTNKFTHICQKRDQVNVKETDTPLNQVSNKVFKSFKTNNKNELLRENIFSTRVTIKKFTKPPIIKFKSDLKVLNQTTDFLSNNKSFVQTNLSMRALQYRNLFKAVDEKILPNESIQPHDAKRRILLQPLIVLLTFIVVFSLSIGTIVYLTYYSKSSHEYESVNALNRNSLEEFKLNTVKTKSEHCRPSFDCSS